MDTAFVAGYRASSSRARATARCSRNTDMRFVAVALSLLIMSSAVLAQELVVSTGSDLASAGPLVAIADVAAELPAFIPFYIAPSGSGGRAGVNPHGFDFLDRDTVVAGHINDVGVDVVDLPTASVIARFSPGEGYLGFGSVRVNPAATHVLLASGTGTPDQHRVLFVVPTPLAADSTPSAVIDLPGAVSPYQTHAITFDATTGRAYVGHTGGITAIDPPYAAANIAFTLALPASTGSYAIELSPDRSVIAASHGPTHAVTIVHAPFSSTSAFEDVPIDGASSLDGLAFVPDGSRLLVTDSNGQDAAGARIYAIAAPFSAVSMVETLTLPPGLSPDGFEDIAISNDGSLAALGGQGVSRDPLVILRAPFTTAGFTAHAIPLTDVGAPYSLTGRGAGTVHFWATATSLPPEIRIDRISTTEHDSGTHVATFTITLSRAATGPVSIDYATTDGTAHAGTDYVASTGTLSLPAGRRTAALDVSVLDDTIATGDRFFRMLLTDASGAVVLQGTNDGTCTIVDDDGGVYIVNDSPLPDAIVGVPYAVHFMVGNDPGTSSWSLSSEDGTLLPDGLVFNAATGVLSGVATHATSSPWYFMLSYLSFPFDATREYALNVRDDTIFADGFDG